MLYLPFFGPDVWDGRGTDVLTYIGERLPALLKVASELTADGRSMDHRMTGLRFDAPPGMSTKQINKQLQELGLATGIDLVGHYQAGCHHKQVKLRVGKWSAQVDEGLAQLLKEVWKADIDTVMSCQENCPGMAWIMFPSMDDLKRFVDIVVTFEKDQHSIYQRVIERFDLSDLRPPQWHLTLALHHVLAWFPDGEQLPFRPHDALIDVRFSVSVRFPHCDIPLIVERLKRRNAHRNKQNRKSRSK